MKTFVLILCILSLHISGQEPSQNVFSLKPAVGFNACQVHGDNYTGFDKFGIFGGLAVNARINKRASLELGFYFSQKGANHNPNPDKGDYDYYRLHLNYLDMPLMFRYHLNSRYFFTTGPSIAYLIGHRENIDYTDYSDEYEFEPLEIGVNIGLGAKIHQKWSVEVRSSNSIVPIRSYGQASSVFYPNPVAQFFNEGFYNNILTVMFSYHLDLTKKTSGQ